MLLGSCCAKPILVGADWGRHANEHSDRGRRKWALEQIYEIRTNALRCVSLIVSWELLAKDLHYAHLKFRTAMPEAFDLISHAANSSGDLQTSEMIRRVKLDDRDRVSDDNVERFTIEHIPVRIGIIGRKFILRNPLDRPKFLMDAVSGFSAVAKDTDTHRTSVLSAVVKTLRMAIDEVQVLEDMRLAADDFFSTPNLDGIVKWARLMSSGHDKRLPYGLKREGRAILNLENGRRVECPRLRVASKDLVKALSHSRKT
jgi:hypothetical protein